MDWVRESDLVVAEVTNLSLGVGYEVGRAIEEGKYVVCLYRETGEKELSAMIEGSPKVKLIKYRDIKDAEKHLGRFLDKLKSD